MFSTRNPVRAIKLLVDTDLVDVAFPLYENTESRWEMDPIAAFAIYSSGFRLLSRTQALASRIFTQSKAWDTTKRRYLWYAAFLKELYEITNINSISTSKRGRREGSGFFQLLADGLKLPKLDIRSIEYVTKGVGALGSFLETQSDHNIQTILQSRKSFHEIPPHEQYWQEMSDLRWKCYNVLKPIGPLWKETLILALASSKQGISESVNQYTDWVTVIEDRLGLGEILGNSKGVKPLLNGAQVLDRALPGVHGEGFKLIMEAQEEWQIRHGITCPPDDAALDVEKTEYQLIDFLVETFPDYTLVSQ